MRILITLLTISIVTLFCDYVQGQDTPEKWFQDNIKELEDLAQLDAVVKGKDYVFIGESSHGADEFFKLKSEIITYLVNKLDFEVVLFESPIVATYLYEMYPEFRVDSLSHCEHILYPLFVNEYFIDLIDHLDSLNVPVGGFDLRLGSEFQATNITQVVYHTFKQIDSTLAESFLEIDRIHTQDYLVAFSKKHKWYKNPYHSRGTMDECNYWMKRYQNFYAFYLKNKDAIADIEGEKSDFGHLIENALLTNITALNGYLIGELYYRDSLMFENIDHLLTTKYLGKKVIFSAHNAHIAKNYESVGDTINYNNQTLGSLFHKKYGEQSIVIGLYGLEGSTNGNHREPVEMTATLQDSTIEYALKNSIKNTGIIEFENYPFIGDYGKVQLCHWGINPQKMLVNDQFDVVIFLKSLSPSSYSDH